MAAATQRRASPASPVTIYIQDTGFITAGSVRRDSNTPSVEFDALIDESKTLEADAPEYPTEEGFSVGDTIILKPMSLSMTLFLSNTPVTWSQRHGISPSRVQDVLKLLEDLYFAKKLVTVETSEHIYRNMAILNIELTKTVETGTSREIPIEFREIRVTESKTTTIPDSYGKSGATGTNAGTASTKTSATPTTRVYTEPIGPVQVSKSKNNGTILGNAVNWGTSTKSGLTPAKTHTSATGTTHGGGGNTFQGGVGGKF